jgi:hypothetical protein
MEELLDIRRDLLVRLAIRQAPLDRSMTWCGKVCAMSPQTCVVAVKYCDNNYLQVFRAPDIRFAGTPICSAAAIITRAWAHCPLNAAVWAAFGAT